ncbi:MAG: hypothetical protein Q9224_006574 [Gallowayella concinna]
MRGARPPDQLTQADPDPTKLLLTNGESLIGRTNAQSRSSTSLSWDQTRSDFVVDKWQETFQQRRKERSRGRSRNEQERHAPSERRSSRVPNLEHPFRRVKLKRSLKDRQLAITQRRQTSRLSRIDRQSAQDNDRSSPNNDALAGKMRTSVDGQHTDSSSASWDSYTSPTSTYDGQVSRLWGSIHGEIPPLRQETPSIRGRRRNSESDKTSRGSEGRFKSHLDGSPEASISPKAYLAQPDRRGVDMVSERGRKRVRVLETPKFDSALVLRKQSPPHRIPEAECKPVPVLRPPTEQFPEDPNFVRPGVAPAEDSRRQEGIPQDARWTKISRELVDPEVLQKNRERYEERGEHVIVLRVLSRKEVEQYAAQTHELRKRKQESWYSNDEDRVDDKSEASSEESDNSQRSFVRYRESFPFGEGSYDFEAKDYKHGNFVHENSKIGQNSHQRMKSPVQNKDADQSSHKSTRRRHGHRDLDNSRNGSGSDYSLPYLTSSPISGS